MATYSANVLTGAGTGGYDTFANSTAATDIAAGDTLTIAFSFATAGLATPNLFVTNDVLQLVKVPKGAAILDFYIDMPDIDSATTNTFNLGLASQGTALFMLNSVLGRSIGYQRGPFQSVTTVVTSPSTSVVGSLPTIVTCASGSALTNGYDVFQLLASAGGAGAGAGGTIYGWVAYNMKGGQF